MTSSALPPPAVEPAPTHRPRARRLADRFGWIAILSAALALHLPRLEWPFGVHDINPANYFGVFAKNYENLGWAELRGVPLGDHVLENIGDQAIPYLSHPPGSFWLCGLLGTNEAGLRGLTAILHLVLALLAVGLLRPSLGPRRSWLAGFALLPLPVLGFYAQVSYELFVLPAALGMLWAYQRSERTSGQARLGWRALTAALAFGGIWLDWQFAFAYPALFVLACSRRLKVVVERLWPAAVGALLGGAAVLGWLSWVKAAGLPGPQAQAGSDGLTLMQIVERAVGSRPSLSEFLPGFFARLEESFTGPVLVLGAIGALAFGARNVRLMLALLVFGLGNALVFPTHTMTHTVFVAYFAPWLCAGLACLALNRGLALILGAVLVGWTGLAGTWQVASTAKTEFFRVVGQVSSNASRGALPGGPEGRRYLVAFNAPYRYGYYVDTGFVPDQAIIEPARLETLRGHRALGGLRYLWLQMSGEPVDKHPRFFGRAPELENYLAQFPKRRVPELELTIKIPPSNEEVRVDAAWLVTIEP